MRFPEPPIPGRLVRRYKRFLADVRLEDESVVTAHCPNTGSLLGCKEPGSEVWLRDSHDPRRKLRTTWQAIRVGRSWVNVDTSLPNRIVAEAVAAGRVPELAGYERVRREVVTSDGHRLDLALERGDAPPCYVEVKSTTLVDGRAALFPDAVTERGKKHLYELVRLAREGARAVQFFFVNRPDVQVFRPADDIDPDYGEALREAASAGVEVLAWRARVAPQRLDLERGLPIELPPLALASGRRRKA